MIAYALNSVYTSWKCDNQSLKQKKVATLVRLLFKYPRRESYLDLVEQIIEHYESICEKELSILSELPEEISNDEFRLFEDFDFELNDELATLALLYLCLNKSKIESHSTELLHKICRYFGQRFSLQQKLKQSSEQVSEYKYKAYGQKEIQQELDDEELKLAFPSYLNSFKEFINTNPLDSNNNVKADEPAKEEQDSA
jgi:hypothetical protein